MSKYYINKWTEEGVKIVDENYVLNLIIFNNVIIEFERGSILANNIIDDGSILSNYLYIFKHTLKYANIGNILKIVINPENVMIFIEGNDFIYPYNETKEINSIIDMHFNPALAIFKKLNISL